MEAIRAAVLLAVLAAPPVARPESDPGREPGAPAPDPHAVPEPAPGFEVVRDLSAELRAALRDRRSPAADDPEFRVRFAAALDAARALAGVPVGVRLEEGRSAAAAEAAAMLAARGRTGHESAPTWRHWTRDGAEALRRSNLALGVEGLAVLDAYLRDDGAGNEAVPHRRWLLRPGARVFGLGVSAAGPDAPPANVLWVVEPEALVPDPTPVAWPRPGWWHVGLVPARWSWSRDGVDFRGAIVSMSNDRGEPVPVSVEHRDAGGWASTITWRPLRSPRAGETWRLRIEGLAGEGIDAEYRFFAEPRGAVEPEG